MRRSCVRCKGPTEFRMINTATQTFTLPGPWNVHYGLQTAQCTQCGGPVRFQDSTFGNEVAWDGWSEVMVAGEDYEVIGMRRGPGRIDGTRPVRITWAWHPMADHPDWSGKVMRQIEQDDGKDPTIANLLILPPTFRMAEWSETIGRFFNEAWCLRPHIMAGHAGPYPSMRAERSILRTLGPSLNMVRYFWPAICLPAQGYCPVATNEVMANTWASYARKHIIIALPKKDDE